MADDFTASTSTTGTVLVGGSTAGNIETAGDTDWFAVTLTAGQTYQFYLVGSQPGTGTLPNTLADPLLRVRDSSGAQLAFNNDGYWANSVLDFTAPTSGIYYVEASSAVQLGTGTYQLTVRPFATTAQLGDFLVNGWFEFVGSIGQTSNSTPRHWASNAVSVNVSGLTAAEQNLALTALQLYHDVANISFNVTTGPADITYTNSGSNSASIANWSVNGAFFTSVTVNISSDFQTTAVDVSTNMFSAYLHETGHALGLGHSGPYNGPPTTYGFTNVYGNDSKHMSVMTYFGLPGLLNVGSDHVITPQMADIYAVQSIYGANITTRGGDTVYGFNSNAGPLFDFVLRGAQVAFTIYDAGGADRIDASGFGAAQRISLVPGSWSSIGGYFENIAIYETTLIEDAIGGSGNDTLIGNSIGNVLNGGTGNDTLDGGAGTDTASYAGAASAVMVSVAVTVAQNTVGAGTDTLLNIENLRGSSFDDTLTGDGGANTLEGGAGADTLNGGGGLDTASYASSASAVFINLATGSIAGGDAAGDTYLSIENLTGSAFGDDLRGDAGANTLSGGAGNDNLFGQGGADTLLAGAGDDYVYFDELDLSGGQVRGGAGYDWVYNVTSGPLAALLVVNLATLEAEGYYGGNGAEQVNASGVLTSVTLYGNGGSDQLTGGSGDDYIYFDAADLSGGSISGGAGYDWAFLNEQVGVSLNLATTGFEGAYGRDGADSFNASGVASSVTLYGNGGSDTLTGGSGDDYIYFDAADLSGGSIAGGSGYDWAYLNEHVAVSLNLSARGFEGGYGRDGADTFDASGVATSVTLYGNGGADTLMGGSGNDYIYFDAADLASGSISGGSGYDYAIFNELGVGATLNLTTTGFEGAVGRNGNDVFTAAGSAGSVSLYGYEGNDTLTGGSGSDYLYGDVGNDTLTGGGDTDYFITYTGWGADTLADFQQGIDKVVMSVSGLAAFSQLTITQDGLDALVTFGANSLRFSNTSAASVDVSDFLNLANAFPNDTDPQMLIAGKGEAGPATLPDIGGQTFTAADLASLAREMRQGMSYAPSAHSSDAWAPWVVSIGQDDDSFSFLGAANTVTHHDAGLAVEAAFGLEELSPAAGVDGLRIDFAGILSQAPIVDHWGPWTLGA